MHATFGATAVLIVIDLQKAIDQPVWGHRNNPQAEQNVAKLLAAWREANCPIIHIRHSSLEANSTYRPHQPGFEFKPESMPLPEEMVLTKHFHSAFIGTSLEQHLHAVGCTALVITGVITNNSVEATVRMAGDLEFETYVVSDATFTFDKLDLDGKLYPAEAVHALSLANMSGEYATVLDTATVLSRRAVE
jgi:nicotinamidase-related amidase